MHFIHLQFRKLCLNCYSRTSKKYNFITTLSIQQLTQLHKINIFNLFKEKAKKQYKNHIFIIRILHKRFESLIKLIFCSLDVKRQSINQSIDQSTNIEKILELKDKHVITMCILYKTLIRGYVTFYYRKPKPEGETENGNSRYTGNIVDRCLSFYPFSFWSLWCLSFFDIRILVTLLVSSNFSCTHTKKKQNKDK